ncbi:MAG: class I SAM-dependent methyltransferase [Syntrophales bacterium]
MDQTTETHDDEIRKQFSRQATHFNEEGRTLSSAEYLQWVVGCLDLKSDFVVLDVAAGTGHLGRAIAPRVKQVIAVDMTSEMLRQGIGEAARDGITNIVFEQGRAEKLRYPDDSFDMVVTRLSLHHFADPYPAILEMMRVCRPGKQIGIMDMVSPDDTTLAARYNRLERLRDPSHTRCLTLAELRTALKDAGLTKVSMASRDIEVNLNSWMDLTGVDAEVRRIIEDELTGELDGKQSTGMRPFRKDSQLMFTQTWTTAVGVK